MPIQDTPDTIICSLTAEGRNLLARAKLGEIVYRAAGWQLGRDGYLETNPVKVKAFVDPATEAVGYIRILSNTFDYGDAVALNGKTYTYQALAPDWSPAMDVPTTVAAIVEKLQDSTDERHYRKVKVDIDPTDPSRIRVTALMTGTIGNQFPISVVNVGSSNFVVTPMTGGNSTYLGDAAYPAQPSVGLQLNDFLDPDGSANALIPPNGTVASTAEFLVRVPEGPVGMNAYGEIGLWVEIIDSRFTPEIGRKVLYAFGHFPIQAKTDRHIYVQRMLINF